MKEIKVLYTLTMRPVNKASKLHSQPLCTWRVLLTASLVQNAITEDGQLTGAISGGCLEGDALNKALFVMAQQKLCWSLTTRWRMIDAGVWRWPPAVKRTIVGC